MFFYNYKWHVQKINLTIFITKFQGGFAFVDDTIWFSHSRKTMQKILDIASEFYHINDIDINNQKTISIILNDKKATNHSLTIQNQPIQNLLPGESTWYFGIYIDTQGIKSPTITILSNKINNIIQMTKSKAIINKQALYIIHHILFSII